MSKNEMSLQQIMAEHKVRTSQKIVRRKLRSTFKNHTKNDRWTFRKGSREYNKVLEILGVNMKKTPTKKTPAPTTTPTTPGPVNTALTNPA